MSVISNILAASKMHKTMFTLEALLILHKIIYFLFNICLSGMEIPDMSSPPDVSRRHRTVVVCRLPLASRPRGVMSGDVRKVEPGMFLVSAMAQTNKQECGSSGRHLRQENIAHNMNVNYATVILCSWEYFWWTGTFAEGCNESWNIVEVLKQYCDYSKSRLILAFRRRKYLSSGALFP